MIRQIKICIDKLIYFTYSVKMVLIKWFRTMYDLIYSIFSFDGDMYIFVLKISSKNSI